MPFFYDYDRWMFTLCSPLVCQVVDPAHAGVVGKWRSIACTLQNGPMSTFEYESVLFFLQYNLHEGPSVSLSQLAESFERPWNMQTQANVFGNHTRKRSEALMIRCWLIFALCAILKNQPKNKQRLFPDSLLETESNMEYTFRAVTHRTGIIIWRVEVILFHSGLYKITNVKLCVWTDIFQKGNTQLCTQWGGDSIAPSGN